MPSVGTWPNSALSPLRAAMARPSYSRSSADEQDDRIPAAARFSLDVLARQYAVVRAQIVAIEKRIHAWHRSSEESRRLEEIPGVGPIIATALVAEVGDWKVFSSGRYGRSGDR